jgi:hypothetical protein
MAELSKAGSTWSNAMNTTSMLTVVATAAAIAAGTTAIPSNADARTYSRHHHAYYSYYGGALRGTYARATKVYAADHYYRRPSQQDFNPDFQLGGNRSW